MEKEWILYDCYIYGVDRSIDPGYGGVRSRKGVHKKEHFQLPFREQWLDIQTLS